MFLETPSSIEVQASMWSDYKQHCTSKYLVSITPNDEISQISSTYGGRTGDVYVVRNSEFLDLLEVGSYHENMLSCAAKVIQITKDDVSETNRVANVCIFV